jgi:hypothetical protein
LAYNLVDESQAARPRESVAPVMPGAELDAYLRDNQNDLENRLLSYLLGSGMPFAALGWPETFNMGRTRINVLEMSVTEAFGDTVLLEITYRYGPGHKSYAGAEVFAMQWVDGALEFGAIDETQTARLDTVSSDGASALARFDGTWTGKGINIMATGTGCPGTIAIEMQVLDGRITGFQTMTTGTKWGTGHLKGTIDASGRLETSGPSYRLRGSLSAESGQGSGEWARADNCQGTFELARVE